MTTRIARMAAVSLAAAWMLNASAQQTDPRLREVWYDPNTVVTVPVKRGVVTHIMLDEQESITEVGSGLGADCTKLEASWCIAAQAGGRNIFVKPKTAASSPNNLAVVTDKHSHAFRFIVLAEGDPRSPTYRLRVRTPVLRTARPARTPPDLQSSVPIPRPQVPSAEELIAERMNVAPDVINSDYSIAEGQQSGDILPTLIFDDGRFTYLRFPNNREVPAVFHILGDGSETLVNTRMEGDLLVVDRVSRRLMLRAGSAVIGVWNEAFDIDGVPPKAATTVNGVERVLRLDSDTASNRHLPGVKP